MKILIWVGWISAATGALIVLFALISLLTGRIMFGFGHVVNFFHAANSFFLMSIALFVYTNKSEGPK